MIFSFFQSKEEKERDRALKRRQEDAQRALAAGDILPSARHRIEHQRNFNKDFFSSDLTVNEFLVSKETGLEILGQVMGTSFYHIRFFRQVRTSSGEIHAISEAHRQARTAALQRMQKEAELFGAHGVVGVKLRAGRKDYTADVVEFTAIGTAVRIPGWTEQGQPFTCDLSGQEFWQIYQAGYRPVSVAMGMCTYYIWTDQRTQAIIQPGLFTPNRNQEVSKYTAGFYDARETALNRLLMDVVEHQAEGCLGMSVESEIEAIDVSSGNTERKDVLIHFSAVGTSVRRMAQPPASKQREPLMVIPLSRGRFAGSGASRLDEIAQFQQSDSYDDDLSDDDFDE